MNEHAEAPRNATGGARKIGWLSALYKVPERSKVRED
jgi:hypothetical protein